MTQMDTLEARSRDVQERTFCKWYACLRSSIHARLIAEQAQHEIGNAWTSTNDILGQGSLGWRASDSAHGEHRLKSVLLGTLTRTRRKSWVGVV